jgi:hypothetical protein
VVCVKPTGFVSLLGVCRYNYIVRGNESYDVLFLFVHDVVCLVSFAIVNSAGRPDSCYELVGSSVIMTHWNKFLVYDS